MVNTAGSVDGQVLQLCVIVDAFHFTSTHSGNKRNASRVGRLQSETVYTASAIDGQRVCFCGYCARIKYGHNRIAGTKRVHVVSVGPCLTIKNHCSSQRVGFGPNSVINAERVVTRSAIDSRRTGSGFDINRIISAASINLRALRVRSIDQEVVRTGAEVDIQ